MDQVGELTGKVFGEYEVGHRVGQGARGAVYLARQTSTNRTVALKVMSANPSHDLYIRINQTCGQNEPKTPTDSNLHTGNCSRSDINKLYTANYANNGSGANLE